MVNVIHLLFMVFIILIIVFLIISICLLINEKLTNEDLETETHKLQYELDKIEKSWKHRLIQGHEFEYYTAHLLRISGFEILEVSGDAKPDLRVRSPNGKVLWIECKWRKDFGYKNNIRGFRWIDSERKIGKYEGVELATKENVFIVAGLGGKSSQPKEMFVFPLKDGFNGFVYDWKIGEYKREPEAVFKYYNSRLV